jgi:hypothetical protein
MSVEIDSQETVFWINRMSKPGIRQTLKSLRILEPSRAKAMTVIPAADIDKLEDEQLRESLSRQLQSVRDKADFREIPVAFMPDKRFSHSFESVVEHAADNELTSPTN